MLRRLPPRVFGRSRCCSPAQPAVPQAAEIAVAPGVLVERSAAPAAWRGRACPSRRRCKLFGKAHAAAGEVAARDPAVAQRASRRAGRPAAPRNSCVVPSGRWSSRLPQYSRAARPSARASPRCVGEGRAVRRPSRSAYAASACRPWCSCHGAHPVPPASRRGRARLPREQGHALHHSRRASTWMPRKTLNVMKQIRGKARQDRAIGQGPALAGPGWRSAAAGRARSPGSPRPAVRPGSATWNS